MQSHCTKSHNCSALIRYGPELQLQVWVQNESVGAHGGSTAQKDVAERPRWEAVIRRVLRWALGIKGDC